MKVCFYSPYIPKHTGGGEKHLFDVATIVSTQHEVSIAIPDTQNFILKDTWKKHYESFLGYSLDAINFIATPLGTSASSFSKLLWTRQFDYLYYVTDGSLFFSLAKKNNLHIQFPFTFEKKSLIDRLKLRNWHIKNTNSNFTKQVIERAWSTDISLVHYPLVDRSEFDPSTKKQKIILHVGRFFKQLHSKRQDILIDVFKQMCVNHTKVMEGWQLVLVGVVEDNEYFEELKKSAQKFPIKFETEVNRHKLVSQYNKSSIYWHATGFDINEIKHPEAVEHFGISTIEAMAAGCVPIVVGKGGQKEILGPELMQLQWQTKDECIQTTLQVIKGDKKFFALKPILSDRVDTFDTKHFEAGVWRMFDE